MFERWQRYVLAGLKVPPAPHPPAGDSASLRVFHAGRNYYRWRMGSWAVTQVLALAALVFWTAMLVQVEQAALGDARELYAQKRAQIPAGADSTGGAPVREHDESWPEQFGKTVEAVAKAAEREAAAERRDGHPIQAWFVGYRHAMVEVAMRLPDWAFPVVWALKLFGFAAYIFQIPLTYAVRRLDFEMRWYMVTDRSLRLRHGVWKVAETTMSFANIQQVVVTQNPLQRLLGVGTVKVTSAGGGAAPEHQLKGDADMHTGLFEHVAQADEIRDLIVERLRQFRESGLGDPEEAVERIYDVGRRGEEVRGEAVAEAAGSEPLRMNEGSTRAAAVEVLREAKALRAAVE